MKPVLFSVSYAGLWGQHSLSLDEFVPHAKALGYGTVELMAKRPHLSVLDYGPEKAKALRGLCEGQGVEVACLAGYTNFAGGRRERGGALRRDASALHVGALPLG